MNFTASVLALRSTSTIATFALYSKRDYSNYNILNCQMNQLQETLTTVPQFSDITPILKYLHWLKINIYFISSMAAQTLHEL